MASVLISGASIAGPALAYWLHEYGWETTVVERAEELREEGQNIDVRGAGREVARRMGIEDEIRAAGTGELGIHFVDTTGAVKASFPAGTSDTDGATAELEILRGELSRIVHERARTGTEFVFGDSISALAETDDGVRVTFEHGAERTFDLVVLAEGLRSHTRALVFGTEPQFRPLGMYTSYLTIPRTADDEDWWRWFNAPGGRTVTLRPDNLGTTRATLSFMSEPRGYEDLDVDAQKDLLRNVFADAGWQAPRVLAGLDDARLYFEAIGQVRAPRWSSGRVVLLGDAAYAPSPISGMGTSLALVGAYVLAGELAGNSDHGNAFAAYEKIMRPYVDQAQKLPPGAPRLANPKTGAGIAVFNTVLRVAASRPVAAISSRVGGLFSPPADAITLPTYPLPPR